MERQRPAKETSPHIMPTPPETDSRTPLTIRGHHLALLRTLENGHLTVFHEYRPTSSRKYAASMMRSYRSVYREALLDKLLQEASEREGREYQYYKDVIGATPIQHRVFQRRVRKYFETFQRLVKAHPDYPIEIVDGRKDTFCETCPIKGDHCTTKKKDIYQARDNNNNTHIKDTRMVEQFINTAKRLGLDNEIHLFVRRTAYSDVENVEATGIRTTIGVVQQVLRGAARFEFDYIPQGMFG
jgi:hypothetical protein